ncbi:MAG: hypothetical protein HY542_05270 [Deltaproteobacteria bacterium]|nr:hypothetical protein [Deltaproteobacteria bacterium]
MLFGLDGVGYDILPLMAKAETIEPLKAAIKDLLLWFREAKVRGLIIGAVASSLLGRPRTTEDVDAMVLLDPLDWSSFLQVGLQCNFEPRREDCLAFARRSRVLLVRHVPTKVGVDISFGALPFEEEALKRGIQVKIGTLSLLLPTPEDLVIMKAVAHRSKDVGDIEGLLMANPELDLKRIRYWVGEFSKVLEVPEIYEDLEKLLKAKPKRGRRKKY